MGKSLRWLIFFDFFWTEFFIDGAFNSIPVSMRIFIKLLRDGCQDSAGRGIDSAKPLRARR
jgi:hypothetical protein